MSKYGIMGTGVAARTQTFPRSKLSGKTFKLSGRGRTRQARRPEAFFTWRNKLC
jgi:hypothetical protein